MELLDQALRGFLVGLLVALIVYYILRPKQPYPRWILTPYEQPWMLVLLAVVVALVYPWDERVALLMLLLLLGVGLDITVFGKSYSNAGATEATLANADADADATGADADIPDPVPETMFEGVDSFAGRPLYVIEPPNYPLVSDWRHEEPGSPAAF